MYKALQEQVQPRMLLILLFSLIFMMLAASYLYVIKKPFLALRESQQTLTLLQNEVRTGVPLQNQIQMQQQLVDQLDIQLRGTGPKLPLNKKVAHVIGELDKIAARHQVHLSSVKPEASTKVFTFRELPFRIEINGDYFSLFAWLKEIEQVLGPVVITKFDLSSVSGQSKERRMVLTIVAYQFEE